MRHYYDEFLRYHAGYELVPRRFDVAGSKQKAKRQKAHIHIHTRIVMTWRPSSSPERTSRAASSRLPGPSPGPA